MAEEVSPEQRFWAKEFDLSALTYQQFLAFFFDRAVVANEEQYKLFRAGIDYFVASTPAIVVDYLQRMCRGLAELTNVYSHEQLDQGLWAVFGPEISCEQYLFDASVDQRARIACVESMYLPFRDVVAKSNLGKRDSFYWMWWDMVFHTDYFNVGHVFETHSSDAKRILEAIHETLVRILAIDHPACHWSALHGLGHLPHPKVRETVQRYLELHRAELSEEDAGWVERCGEGKIE